MLHDLEVIKQKTLKHAFYVLYSEKNIGFDQSEHAQGPLYIILMIIN